MVEAVTGYIWILLMAVLVAELLEGRHDGYR